MGSMQNLPMSRRNDRGYSSDMDGGSRGRGGSMRGRGGGRGRGGPGGRQNDSRYNAGTSTISDYVNNVDKRKPMGNGRGRGPTSNGRSSRGGPSGDRSGRDRPNRGVGAGRANVDTVAGGDRERKWFSVPSMTDLFSHNIRFASVFS